MARLDPYIDRMFAESARELTLESGAGAVLAGARGPLPLLRQPLTAQQVVGAIAEIVPDDQRAGFPRPGVTVFPYAAPAGVVEVRLDVKDDAVRVVVVPRASPSAVATATAPSAPAPAAPVRAPRSRLVPGGDPRASMEALLNKKCLVNQREIGVHTGSFKAALRAALREDPDVVLVGELRDLETIAIAIETAETGHLVFGTLHTNTAPSTVDRIIDQFPADRQAQIRMMLSESLKGVVSQTLCKKIGGGRAAAQEVLLCTSGVSNLIREGKTFQIPSMMQTGRAAGMVMLNDALLELVKKKLVEPREAYLKAVAKAEMKAALERLGTKLELAA